MTLDMRTLMVVIVLIYGLFGVFQIASWLLRRGDSFFLLLGLSNLCGALGSQLIAMRGLIADGLSIVVGNGVLILSFALMWSGLRRFAGQAIHWWVVVAAPSLLMALFAFVAPIGESLTARLCVFVLLEAIYGAACFRDAWLAQREELLRMRRLAMATFLATSLFMAFRAWATLRDPSVSSSFMGPSTLQSLATFISLLIVLVWNLAVHLMASERLENRLLGLAHSDALTNVLNRAGFSSLSQRQIARSLHDRRPVSLLLMDLDHFKRVNDRHGHETGDRLLCAFVEVARQVIRPGDLLARHGGEEFCALLPGSTRAEAAAVAERIRKRFEAEQVPGREGGIGTTVSIGIAELALPGENLDQALNRADQALYAAKRQGRNRIAMANEPGSAVGEVAPA